MAEQPSNSREQPPRSDEARGGLSSKSPKVVSIADPEIDSISPLMRAKNKELDQGDYFDLDRSTKQYRASTSGKRLTGRPSSERLGAYSKAQSLEVNPSLSSLISEASGPAAPRHHENLVKHVSAWLKGERARRAARKAKRKATKAKQPSVDAAGTPSINDPDEIETEKGNMSEDSEGSVALEALADILEREMSTLSLKSDSSSRHRLPHPRKLSSIMKRHSTISSGEDYFDSIDQLVPSVEATLDNSKTFSYSAGGPESESTVDLTETGGKRARKEKEAWSIFKYEIVRLAHTLRLKGWRRVPLDQSNEIDVQRLSGALTNAVYVVSPPKDCRQETREDGLPTPKNPPPKLLLRIYGPQVEHLIDRESELQILRRLARKRIGPRMLGTFSNGRFEEFFHARPLTPQELRLPDTSKQIAKRMRELHEGIDLLQSEREAGPFVWQNWDKWVNRVEQIVMWLDKQVIEGNQGSDPSLADKRKAHDFVLGVEWGFFKQVIYKYRKWLDDQYGGKAKVNERLVFAHNDTQYGNILRMTPSGESPLLLPANEHKQLIVIDFEYSNANLPGLEFANHFTEWCYNYHDSEASYRCNTVYYPTPEEQHRFIYAYLVHNPTFKAPRGSASNPPTPHLAPMHTSGSSTALTACAAPTSISAFMLDSRAPAGKSYEEREAQTERKIEEEASRLMAETRLWRLANSAQWVAWGIVQADIPGMPKFDEEGKETAAEDTTTAPAEDAEHKDVEKDAEEEFDYLAYAQDRAMFLWGDAIRLGIIQAEELPEEVRKRVKMVEY